MDAFCGIDVAFAKAKRLPISVCIRNGSRLKALPLRHADFAPPRGAGNRAALQDAILADYTRAVAEYLDTVSQKYGVRIKRVAIDAPRDFAPEGRRRECERAMDAAGLSCFATPSRSQFEEIRRKAARHLALGGLESRLPHANQLWMLVGFSLFRTLEKRYECLEVFPNAIVKALDPSVRHKSTTEGIARQLQLLSGGAGIAPSDVDKAAFGSRHDRLDAVLSAWVASHDRSELVAHGDGQADTIWSFPRSMRSVA